MKKRFGKKKLFLTVKDNQFIVPHQNNGHPIFQKNYYQEKFFISGSETSTGYGGYMQGAVRSAFNTVNKIKNI